ncbi:MAG: metallophosphoesterase [Lutimonas sp.]
MCFFKGYKLLFLISLVLFFTACRQSPKEETSFSHDIEGSNTPWNKKPVESEGDFSFAIISDLTGGERERIFEVAVEQINHFDPRFVLSVGDLIEGGTEDTLQLKREWEFFDQRADKLEKPFFHLGGNHDLTNPVMKQFWNSRYGRTYYHFIYNEILFLMLDSEDYDEKRMLEIYEARAKALKMINGELEGEYTDSEYYHMEERKTGSIGRTQRLYFEEVLKNNPQVKWTFVLMHKPLWKNQNLEEWASLQKALAKRSHTVINGHYHSFSYEKKGQNAYIMLGTTGGAQNAEDPNSFDHFTWVKMNRGVPTLSHLRMDGVLNAQGKIPIDGDTLSFQAYKPHLTP